MAVSDNTCAILTYHSLDSSDSVISVAPNAFGEQMRSLAALGWRGISLREAVNTRTASGRWPERAVALTFDDGYANMHEHALPVLARHGFSATVFLITGHVGERSNWGPPPRGLDILPMLTWAQVRELAAAGIEVGAHTQTHPDLAKLSEEEVTKELAASRAAIEAHVGADAESFAYPFGATSPVALRVAAREFRSACTTVLGRASDQPLNQLPRVDMYYIRTPRHLARLVRGELDRYLALRRWARTARQMAIHG